jgi:hypothetical protein
MITRIEDPAITELKRIVENDLSTTCSFMYANLFEANFGLDDLSLQEQFPVFLFIATDKSTTKITTSGLIVRDIVVVGMMLNSIPNDGTIDFKSKDVSPYIEEMRQLTDNLIYNVNKSSLTYAPSPVQNYSVDKIYSKFDQHLFGCGVTFTWSLNTNSRGC